MNAMTYWERRDKERLDVENMEDMEVKLRTLEIVEAHMTRVQHEIESFYQHYADGEGIPNSEAKKKIDKIDFEEYERLAQYYVRERENKNVSRTDKANAEMKLYNVTMKINREKLLMAKLGQHIEQMGFFVEHEVREYLESSAIREFERNAGILGNIEVSQTQFNALINSTPFSDGKMWLGRLWDNMAEIQAEVEKAVQDSLIRGKHPDTAVKRLKELTGRTDYEVRRLLLSETTRAQSEASLLSYKEREIKQFIFFAHLDKRTTQKCRTRHKEVYRMSSAIIGENVPPLHQFCRSSIAPYIDPDNIVQEGGGTFNIFNDDDDLTDEEFEGDDEGDDLLDELDGLLDRIEGQAGKGKKKKPIPKQTIEKIEKVVEVEKPKPVFNESMMSQLTGENIDALTQMFNQGDPRAVQMFNKYGTPTKLELWRSSGAHHNPRTNTVKMNHKEFKWGSRGDGVNEYSRTFFHEYGHAIDHNYGRHADRKTPMRHYASHKHISPKYEMNMADMARKEYDEYEKAYKKNMDELTGEKWKIGDIRDMIKSEITKNPTYLWADLSDMIEGASGAKQRLGWGHGGAGYWKQADYMLSVEIFAELYSLMINSAEAYQFTAQYLPKTVEIFEELIERMANDEDII